MLAYDIESIRLVVWYCIGDFDVLYVVGAKVLLGLQDSMIWLAILYPSLHAQSP